MRIVYEPNKATNFHNSQPIHLRVSGEQEIGLGDHSVYLVSKKQSKRIERHFCGIAECRCPAGAVQQLDPDGNRYGIRVDWTR